MYVTRLHVMSKMRSYTGMHVGLESQPSDFVLSVHGTFTTMSKTITR